VAKKTQAVYEPGELDRVRRNLGEVDKEEAKRIAALLGGEVGVERATPTRERHPASRDETVTVSVRGNAPSPKRRVETVEVDGTERGPRRQAENVDPSDDPTVAVRISYRERLKIDRYLAQAEFEIKNSSQVLYSMLSLFGNPPDFVSPVFVTSRMNEYYGRLELLVTSTRNMLPRNNVQRTETLRNNSPFAFRVLETIRHWNIERIASELAHLQAKPREARVDDFVDILKAFYKPLYLLGKLDIDTHVKDAYQTLYKQLQAESPGENKERHNTQFRAALAAYAYLARSVHFYLYPLLLKILSDRWLSYEDFFIVRRRRFEAFLGAKDADRIPPPPPKAEAPAPKEKEEPAGPNQPAEDAAKSAAASPASSDEAPAAEAPAQPSRAWTRSIESLESLFPEAGWRKLSSFPDLYPYFADVFDLKKGYELVSPQDPLHQVAILMHILEELFYGLRFVRFGTISGSNGEAERVDEAITHTIGHWHGYLEESLGKEYLPRLSEYCRLVDSSPESRVSNYAKRTLSELLWVKRLNFMPFLHFESSIAAHPYRRTDVKPCYAVVRELRRLLTGVAAGIEAGMKQGGAASMAPCDGIDNPWEPYVFQVPNPLSQRLDALLGGKGSRRKTNAALVFFTLSAATVLDEIINDRNGYAYFEDAVCPYRSADGIKPTFGVDERINADALFRQALKRRAGGSAPQEP
jgi:hypothetical protein